jgi:hypothetical protein
MLGLFLGLLACPVAPPQVKAPQPTITLPSHTVRSPMARLEESPRVSIVTDLLSAVVHDHLRDVDNPWAVAHALIVLGPDAKSETGERLIDGIFSRYAQPVVVGEETLIKFPAKRGRVRIEPHTDLILKALTEAGARPEMEVLVQGDTLTLEALYRNSLWQTDQQIADYDDIPWTLQAIAGWAEPDLSWRNHQGQEMTLDAMTHAVANKLQEETAFLRVDDGVPLQKRGQGIFKYTCGGAHLAQGAAYAVARGFGELEDRKTVEVSVDGWLRRLNFELKQIDAGLVSNPEYRLVLLIQRMKFLGHLVETLHKMAGMNLMRVDERVSSAAYFAEEQLLLTVMTLAEQGVFDNLSAINKKNEQMFFDVAGDAAHALRALQLARGATFTY